MLSIELTTHRQNTTAANTCQIDILLPARIFSRPEIPITDAENIIAIIFVLHVLARGYMIKRNNTKHKNSADMTSAVVERILLFISLDF